LTGSPRKTGSIALKAFFHSIFDVFGIFGFDASFPSIGSSSNQGASQRDTDGHHGEGDLFADESLYDVADDESLKGMIPLQPRFGFISLLCCLVVSLLFYHPYTLISHLTPLTISL